MEETKIDLDSDKLNLSRAIRDRITRGLAAMAPGRTLLIPMDDGGRLVFKRDADNVYFQLHLRSQRLGRDRQIVTFTPEDESAGTRRLLYLLPALWLLTHESVVVVIDEIDIRLHTLACQGFIQSVLQASQMQDSQLIFTTHDTNLLDLGFLRRDEIWFVEKDKFGASELYSLADFNTRPDLKVEKGYLNGRFGALPFSGEIRRLGFSSRKLEDVLPGD